MGLKQSLRAVVFGLLALILAAPAAAAFPGRNGDLAYGWSEVYEPDVGPSWSYVKAVRLIAPRGGDPRTVTGCDETVTAIDGPPPGPPTVGCVSATYANPAVRADGARIAFDNGAALALVDADGSDLRVLPSHSGGDGEPAFSAAGGRLAFSTDEDGIWIRNLATDAVLRATRHGADPDWSSRNWIAFERGGQIWRIRPGGRGLEQLTRRGGISPAWSPHGTKLAFVRHGTIVVLDLRTRRLGRAFGGNSPVDLAWSPDGRRVAWTTFDGSLQTARIGGADMRTLVTGGVGGTYNLGVAGLDWAPRR